LFIRQTSDFDGFRFTKLLKNTELSRDTLSRHLKDLFKQGLIKHDYLTKRYSISHDGLEKLGIYERLNVLRDPKYSYTLPSIDQENIQTLSSAKFVSLSDILVAISEFTTGVADAFRSAGMLRPSFLKEDYKILEKCITFSIYSDKPLEEENLQHSGKMMRELLFVFWFDKDKFEDLRKAEVK
jgi:DNA-binding transcriptional ArsR family regulator